VTHALIYLASDVVLAAIVAMIATWLGPIADRWRRAYLARQLEARLTRGDDRYFEELRTLRSDASSAPYAHSFLWHFVRFLPILWLISIGHLLFSE
jgi:hypothetical protein